MTSSNFLHSLYPGIHNYFTETRHSCQLVLLGVRTTGATSPPPLPPPPNFDPLTGYDAITDWSIYQFNGGLENMGWICVGKWITQTVWLVHK